MTSYDISVVKQALLKSMYCVAKHISRNLAKNRLAIIADVYVFASTLLM
jgi:hypothetical protein